ncbi:SPARC-like protein 1 [Cyprinodon tularosa]|uniref:SPARC-like protein 1 n=1 Tax=Cyprinodon tularosa TaxID=77115 RepID=UPI0018E28E54|nr:SPARC-like protein 1 [Cyprinodon tularosa]XP_038128320.1 SPARC-like protein 1 [Cyprinodon tularosa]
MKACWILIFLLGAMFAPSVEGKSHGKHHGIQKTSHPAKEKDIFKLEASMPQVSPTMITFETSSHVQEDEETSSEDNTNAKKADKDITEKSQKSPAILLSEEELTDLLKKEAEEDKVTEEREGEDNNMKTAVTESEVTLNDEKKPHGGLNPEKKSVGKSATKLTEHDGQVGFLEETESSTESELPADLDYAADSGILIPAQVESKDLKPSTENQESPPDVQSLKIGDKEEETNNDHDLATSSKENQPGNNNKPEVMLDHQEFQSSPGLKSGSQWSENEEERGKNESGAFIKKKTKKQKKNKRARKHSPQRNETHLEQHQGQLDHQGSEGSSTETVVHKPKRKRTGTWGPLVGVNPVQIRAAVDLYPSSRSSFSGDIHLSGTMPEPCDNYRCKRGKTCKLDADGKPGCVCQEPSECRPSINEFEHVCGTDNKTYETSCELFATKCKFEGTKRGQKLHLDYSGPCKLIPPCVKNELVQFPLRMRDWLKNVLLQLYEHDAMSPGFLTPKQRFRVKKIFENDRRLHAGNHSVELLAQDFEKNYNMYIYPVHWQFAQLDQHPSDRILSHSELAPLRVPLVPMEHCTSLFFQECDADKDKQVTFKEWTSCFGIKDEDVDLNLLF